MFYFQEYLQTDPAKKKEDWGNNMVTHLRTYWRPLVDPTDAEENMNIILSRYDMGKVMKMFKDPKKLGMEFMAIAVMEKVRNILLGEATKAGIGISINALDPVAQEQKKKDMTLLANRKDIEEIISFLQTSIGLPEYSMKNEKKISGKEPFGGNLEMFDELGLDGDDPQDRGYFMKAWHRLNHEMDAQQVVNSYFQANELENHIEDWMNDILAHRTIAAQSFVNEITGAQDIQYKSPASIKLIPGRRRDGKDAVCIGTDEVCTLGDFIKRMGNDFSIDQEYSYVINAINNTNRTNFSGVWDGRDILYGQRIEGRRLIHINDFMNFKVSVGYMEFKHWDQKVFKKGMDFNGNMRLYQRSVGYQPEPDSGYSKESWYDEFTYKTWYLATSSNSQRLYKFGKLFHQVIVGAEDEYSSYSILFRKTTGPTVAEVSKPWIELAQECFTKFRWMIRKAKPKGRSYNYESLVQIARHMIRTGSTKEQVHQVIQMFEEGVNEIFTIPKLDGQRVGGGIVPNMELPNGLDPTAISFQGIIDWAVQNIKSDLGINDIREAYSPKTNDVYKLQAATLESSRNATSYMGTMMDGLLRDIGKHTLATTQDIVKYKQSLAYKYLYTLVGQGPISSMEELQNIALHRYGIFVNSYSTYVERQEIKRDTEIAFQNGEITFEIKILVNAIDDYRKAAYVLAYEKQRAQKTKEKEIATAQQNLMAAKTAEHAMKMEEINAAGKWGWDRVDRQGYWYFRAHQDDNQARVTNNDIKGEQRRTEILEKTDAEIKKLAAKKNLESQEPLPA